MHVEAFEGMKQNLAKYGKGRTLDVGSLQVKPKHTTFRELCVDYVGTDIVDGPNVDVLCNTTTLPFTDGEFDTVITGSCFEHCENPFALIKECARVLKPGGYFIGVAPMSWPEHHTPDYWRILPDGWSALFRHANLTVVETKIVDIAPGFADCWGIAKNEKP